MPAQKFEGISRNAFAKKVGVTPAAVRQKIANGRLAGAVLPDGSLDEAEATRLWEKNTAHQMKRERTAREAREVREGEYKIKLRQMQVDLETAEEKLKALKGETVKRSDAIAVLRALMRGHRDNFLNFAARRGPVIAARFGLKPAEFIGVLDVEIRAALIEFADAPNPFEKDSAEEPADA